MIHSDRFELDLSDGTIRIQNYQNCWKLPKLLRCRKAHNLKLSKISISNVKISRLYHLHSPWNKLSKSVTVGSGQFIISNISASLKIVIQICFHFFKFFLKVLELFECRRGDPYMTANRNIVRFAQSYLNS